MKPRMREIDIPMSPDIDRPGETVRLERDHAGRIVCGHLIVESGVRADVVVSAEHIDVKGDATGHFFSNRMTVFQSGSAVGRCKATLLQVAGRVNGFVHARRVMCRTGSTLEGGIVADDLRKQDDVSLMSYLGVGPGFSDRGDLVDRVEAMVFPRPAQVLRIVPEAEAEVEVRPVAPVVSAEAPRAVDPEPVVVAPRLSKPVAPVREDVVEPNDDAIPYLIR